MPKEYVGALDVKSRPIKIILLQGRITTTNEIEDSFLNMQQPRDRAMGLVTLIASLEATKEFLVKLTEKDKKGIAPAMLQIASRNTELLRRYPIGDVLDQVEARVATLLQNEVKVKEPKISQQVEEIVVFEAEQGIDGRSIRQRVKDLLIEAGFSKRPITKAEIALNIYGSADPINTNRLSSVIASFDKEKQLGKKPITGSNAYGYYIVVSNENVEASAHKDEGPKLPEDLSELYKIIVIEGIADSNRIRERLKKSGVKTGGSLNTMIDRLIATLKTQGFGAVEIAVAERQTRKTFSVSVNRAGSQEVVTTTNTPDSEDIIVPNETMIEFALGLLSRHDIHQYLDSGILAYFRSIKTENSQIIDISPQGLGQYIRSRDEWYVFCMQFPENVRELLFKSYESLAHLHRVMIGEWAAQMADAYNRSEGTLAAAKYEFTYTSNELWLELDPRKQDALRLFAIGQSTTPMQVDELMNQLLDSPEIQAI